jgi:NAD(P)-dependent dehydrogenase (short-subunit alcohol dehydrogenase family)
MTAEASTSKVALVTGGGTGIGRAIATALQRDGFRVAILGRRPERLESPEGFHGYPCDIADAGAIGRTVAKVLSDLGRLDVLVNNAAVIKNDNLEDTTEEAIAYQVGVNVLGTINMTKACLPSLKAARGSIINISSTLAKLPILGTSVYSATKGAMESFNRAIALELGPSGVRVNCIAPALVRSEIYYADGLDEAGYEQMMAEFGSRYLLGRVGEPEDVAELAAYLVSDRAGWMTGAVIPVDSGYRSVGFKQG